MKKILFSVLIAATLFSCKKDKVDNNNNTTTDSYFIKCKVNGRDFNGNVGLAINYYFRDDNKIHLQVAELNNGQLSINLDNNGQPITNKSYALDFGHVVCTWQDITNAHQYFSMDSVGDVTITSLDTSKKVVTGSFNFTALDITNGDSAKVENGTFKLKFEIQ